MSQTLPYLYAVYTIIWLFTFIYLFSIVQRQKSLDKEIAALKMALEESQAARKK